jgi:atypical dual specificity phosphatase
MIPAAAAGLRKPEGPAEVAQLAGLGIGAIVSLMDDDANLNLYEEAGIPHLWLPIKGGTSPTVEQILRLKSFITENVSWNFY